MRHCRWAYFISNYLLFELIHTNICPKILEVVDNSYMFYIDIEYCENYNILNTSQNLNQILKKLFTILKENVYIMKKPLLRDNNWLNNYVISRLRFNDYKLLDENIDKLLNIDKINWISFYFN